MIRIMDFLIYKFELFFQQANITAKQKKKSKPIVMAFKGMKQRKRFQVHMQVSKSTILDSIH